MIKKAIKIYIKKENYNFIGMNFKYKCKYNQKIIQINLNTFLFFFFILST
jgi:hypothetical protein